MVKIVHCVFISHKIEETYNIIFSFEDMALCPMLLASAINSISWCALRRQDTKENN